MVKRRRTQRGKTRRKGMKPITFKTLATWGNWPDEILMPAEQLQKFVEAAAKLNPPEGYDVVMQFKIDADNKCIGFRLLSVAPKKMTDQMELLTVRKRHSQD